MGEQWKVLDKLLTEDVDRRVFIRRLAVAGATPAVAAFLSACGSESGGSGGSPATRAATADGYAFEQIGPLPDGEASARPLIFDAWDFKPDLVRNALGNFDSGFNEQTNFALQPGDYASVMVNKFMSKRPLELFYSQDQVVKFYTAGWVQDLSGLWNIDEIKKATLPVQWEVQTHDGAVLGLPYFNSAKGVVATNELLREKAGLSGYPKNREELYAECRELKRQGVAEFPIIMHWSPEAIGVTQMWAGESICRGDQMWADDLSAVFDASSPAAAVLEDWSMLHKDKIVSPSNVSWLDSDRLDAFGTGKYVYMPLNGYNLYDINDPQQSNIAGHVMVIPFAGEPWGFLDYALYSVARKDTSQESEKRLTDRAAQLVQWMGYKDDGGNYAVAKEWMKQAFLGTGYPELWDDPEVVASFKSWMPDMKLVDVFKAHYENAVPLTGWRAPWYPDFNTTAQPILANAITGSVKVPDAIKQLSDAWQALQQQYS